MANEGMVVGKEYTLMAREAVEDVDELPDPISQADIDRYLVYGEGVTINKKRAPLRKTGHSPYRKGWKSKRGALSFPFSIDVMEVYATAISAGTTRPLNDDVWDLLGFLPPTYATAPPETVVGGQALTRVLGSAAFPGVTIKHYIRDEQGNNRTLWSLVGAKAEGSISGGSAEPLVVAVRTGMAGKNSSIADTAISLPDLSYIDTEGDCPLPLVCEGVAIVAMETVEGVPDLYLGEIKNFEFTIGNTISERRSIRDPGGLAKVQNTAGNYVELSMEVLHTDTVDWDAYRAMEDNIPLEITFRFDDSEDPNNRFYIHGFFQLEDIDEGEGEEVHTRTLSFHGLFDESDGWTRSPATATAGDPGCTAGNSLSVRWETIP